MLFETPAVETVVTQYLPAAAIGAAAVSDRQDEVAARGRAVHPHVPVQVAGLREPQQTQLALVRFLAGMDA